VNLGTPELLIILLVVLLLFGGAKLPKLARSLGEAKQEFERGTKHDDDKVTEVRTVVAPAPEPAPKPDTVTMSREELERLIDERARKVVRPPEDNR
jgi:sec-independent protein translocase protein TatA